MPPLPFSNLETVYEELARAIDRAGSQREALFLAKLALLQARRLGSLEDFRADAEAALKDLELE